jgi:hypothetical protein
MKVLLLTGKSYLFRREIKALGGKWNYEKEGWLIPSNKLIEAQELEKKNPIYVEEIEIDFDPFKPMTTEELRAYRQAKAGRRSDRLLKRAYNGKKQAEVLDKQLEPFASDYAFITQPILVGHHSENSFRRLKERIHNKIDKSMTLRNEADDLIERAEYIRNNVSVKGDAERRRQAKRDANDKIIKVGSKIMDFAFGIGDVVKINKLTYTIKWDKTGMMFTRDKSYIKIIK